MAEETVVSCLKKSGIANQTSRSQVADDDDLLKSLTEELFPFAGIRS